MDYQGSVYYYDGYSNFMKGKSQFHKDSLDDYKRRDWIHGYDQAKLDHNNRMKRDLQASVTEVDSSSQQFESLALKPMQWCGEGLPPAGCEVEAFITVSGSCLRQWRRVVVALAGISGAEKECLVYDAETTAPSWADEFRPLRNQEELKREEACSAIKSIIVEFDLENVENRGDEMDIAKEIFFSIRAGKIPHIKLEYEYE